MSKIERLHVFYHGRKVGTMMLYRKRLTAFEYDNTWLIAGFPISPFSLPLEKKYFFLKSIHLKDCSVYSQTVFQTDGASACRPVISMSVKTNVSAFISKIHPDTQKIPAFP